MGALRGLRSLAGAVAALLWFFPGGLVLYAGVVPAAALFPSRRPALASWYVKMMTRVFLALLRLGGSRFRSWGRLPTSSPALLVMNHQSLADVLTAIDLGTPFAPAFVARRRYGLVPVVGTSIRLLGGPVIDPRRDSGGAARAMARAAAELEHGLVVFPEGHRSRDGSVLPFRTVGLESVLRARRLPVYLGVTDGLWMNRRLVDALFNLHRIRAETEVLGPFEPPADPEQIPAFVQRLRETLVDRLRRRRGTSEGFRGDAAAV